MTKKTAIITLGSCLLFSCQIDEQSPSEKAMEQYENVMYQANNGFHVQKMGDAEIPFGDIAGELDGESGFSLPPGAPEIGTGGTGGPEMGTGGPGTPDISRGGTGSPGVPRGGVGVPGGTSDYASAVCEFVDEVCQLLVACSVDMAEEEFACAEIASICVPLLQEFSASFATVPPAAFTYLQCLTNEIRSSSCSIFYDEEGFVDTVDQCLPGGIPDYSDSLDDDFDDFGGSST